MENFETISKMKPAEAYANGFNKGWNEVCGNFWQIITTLYEQGVLQDAHITRFATIGTLPK